MNQAPLRFCQQQWVAKKCVILALSFFVCVSSSCVIGQDAGDIPQEDRAVTLVRAMRERRYFDTALEFIAVAEKDSRISKKDQASIQFEKALTLLEQSKTMRDFDQRSATLDEAGSVLNAFAAASPNHPLVPRASAERAQIFFERARTLTLQSRAPSNAGKKKKLQAEARSIISQARDTFQKAFDQYKAKWESYPRFVDEKERELKKARRAAETGYLTAKLNLAKCRYEEGQTYDENDSRRKTILTAAAKEFSKIHDDHRSQFVGLFARMMQGKCFEEQGDITIALGLYNELIGHGGEKSGDTNTTLRSIRNQVIRFRLICLNHEKKRDYQLAVVEGTDWLASNTGAQRTKTGLGIRWEVARAQEMLANSRVQTEEKGQRDLLLRKAMDSARTINKYEGEFKEPSAAMIRRIKVALGQNEGDPKDFDTAFELSRSMIRQIGAKKDAVAQAKKPADKQTATEALSLHLSESSRLLRLALDLSNEKTDPASLVQARYLLSFVYYQQKRSLESIILANHVMRFTDSENDDTAMNASEVALAACVQAYNQAGNDNDTEIRIMQEVASRIVKKWPGSESANDARMKLGRLFSLRNDPRNAAKWYTSIPPSAPQYAEAQMAAGQAFWAAWLPAAALKTDDDNRPAAETLDEWKKSAEKYLKSGIALDKTIARNPSDTLTAARVSLCQIHNMAGRFAETIKVIKTGTHPVLKHVEVPEGQTRPEKGVKSQAFAGLCYQLLLRAYVGTQQIDDALTAMQDMEALGGANNTQIYVELGHELEKEIQRLKSANETDRLANVRSSFEKFLNELFQRREGQTYNSLIWIAETYYGLGQGMGDSTGTAPAGPGATQYFSKASQAYQDIISKKLIGPEQQTGIKLRLVNCKRAQGDFETGMQLVADVLKAKPRALDAHVEAARLLQSWGTAGPNRAPLLEAINGRNVGGTEVWGWATIAQKLYAAIAAGQDQPEYKQKYLEASYSAITCRHEYGKLKPDKSALEAAQNEVEVFASVAGDVDQTWWNKFDLLYKAIQIDRGIRPPDPLVVPESYAAEPLLAEAVQSSDTETVEAKTAEIVLPESSPMSPLTAGIAVLVALAGAAGFFFMIKPKKRRVYASAAGGLEFQPPGDLPIFDDPPAFPDAAMFADNMSATPVIGPPGTKPVRKKSSRKKAGTASGAEPTRRRKKMPSQNQPNPATAVPVAEPVQDQVPTAKPIPTAKPVKKTRPAQPAAGAVPTAKPVAKKKAKSVQDMTPEELERAKKIAARKKAAIAARRKAALEQQGQATDGPPVAQPVKKKVVKKKKRPPEA